MTFFLGSGFLPWIGPIFFIPFGPCFLPKSPDVKSNCHEGRKAFFRFVFFKLNICLSTRQRRRRGRRMMISSYIMGEEVPIVFRVTRRRNPNDIHLENQAISSTTVLQKEVGKNILLLVLYKLNNSHLTNDDEEEEGSRRMRTRDRWKAPIVSQFANSTPACVHNGVVGCPSSHTWIWD